MFLQLSRYKFSLKTSDIAYNKMNIVSFLHNEVWLKNTIDCCFWKVKNYFIAIMIQKTYLKYKNILLQK